MRNPLQRLYGQGHLHFITFSCYRRRPLLGTVQARDRFVKILGEVRQRSQFALYGFVVMPEHVHLLISESGKKDPSRILQVLKQRVARALLKKPRQRNAAQLCLPFEGTQEETHFWQRRFYDFNVWSEKKLKEKLDYMHRNPLQRGLVQHPQDWPWSSWAHCAGKRAILKMDEVRTRNDGQEQKKIPHQDQKKHQHPHP